MNIVVELSLIARLSLTSIALLHESSASAKLSATFENWK